MRKLVRGILVDTGYRNVEIVDGFTSSFSRLMNKDRLTWLFAPVHAAALATAAKSFRDNPLLGNPSLNRAGLHLVRMRAAATMAAWRRRRLEGMGGREDAAAFASDGLVLKRDYLPVSA